MLLLSLISDSAHSVVPLIIYHCYHHSHIDRCSVQLRCYPSNKSFLGGKETQATTDNVDRSVHVALASRDLNGLNIIGEDVLHVQETTETTGAVPRDQVVKAVQDALNGKNNFEEEVTFNHTIVLQDLTSDGMELYEVDDLSKAFTVSNAFVKSTPDIFYQVDCPAEADGDLCEVTMLEDEGPNELVSCWSQDGGMLKEDIPSKCDDVVYDTGIYVLPGGPHFFILGVKQDANVKGCPPNIAFSSFEGQKKMSAVFMDDTEGLSMYVLGAASLGNILQAEESAEAIDESVYNVATNNCVHYAQTIWRSLGFEETEEMATFIIENAVNDDHFMEYLAKKRFAGGLRYLASFAIGGSPAMQNYVKDMVHSQLDIRS